MSKSKPVVIKGYVYHQNHGKVKWDRAAWEQFLANYKQVKIEKLEQVTSVPDDGGPTVYAGKYDYLISARGSTKDGDWKQRNLIAEAYELHPTK